MSALKEKTQTHTFLADGFNFSVFESVFITIGKELFNYEKLNRYVQISEKVFKF